MDVKCEKLPLPDAREGINRPNNSGYLENGALHMLRLK